MARFKIKFVGRKQGAIGIFYPIEDTILVAEDQADYFRGLADRILTTDERSGLYARPEILQLYDRYEHIQFSIRQSEVNRIIHEDTNG